MDKPRYVYVTYIKTTAEKVWQALTDGELTRQFWGGQQNVNGSAWQVGSDWRHVFAGDPGSNYGGGTVIESERPHRFVLSGVPPTSRRSVEA